MAIAQDSDVELQSLLESVYGLELKQLRLPSSERLLYCDISTVAQTLYTGWISRFGVPEIITSDRGTNFETNRFQALSKFLAANKTRATSFHPAANGIVERIHRQLKTAIKCYASSSWLEVLPTVLLGMRGCLKEDIGASSAKMVYGQCLRLPGEFFKNSLSSRQTLSQDIFLQRLRLYTRRLHLVLSSHHSSSNFLCILIFVLHHMFLCILIRLENR
ncbi:hypothetical protein AVEN_64432-1 [Araneus ventricosus]|uniref:Integrase catalytic domain-containing protein n=1 Tax=Araneus ventricosus TaxID=182803 RepID=A0A4Y2T3I5_ARAVE|nr:hypothetical protein AVEN_64432-1 [Araneus ventricosus]